MKQVSIKNGSRQEKSLILNMGPRVREGILIFFIAIAVYFMIALATYHSSDPGFSSSGVGNVVLNAGGRIGAWFADIFITLFGYIAYVFPVMLVFSVWTILFKERGEEGVDRYYVALRLLGFLLTLMAACGFMQFELIKIHHHLPNAGGVLGSLLTLGLTEALNPVGALLIFIAFFLIGITLYTGLSWFFLFEQLGRFFLLLGKYSLLFLKLLKIKFISFCQNLIARYRTYRENKSKIVPVVKPKMPEKRADPLFDTRPVTSETQVAAEQKKRKREKTEKVDYEGPVTMGLPPLSLLAEPKQTTTMGYSQEELQTLSRQIEEKLRDFDLQVKVVAVHPGPVITRFELELAPGLKGSRITALVKDLARALSASSVRVVEVIPGKSVIGLEIPNAERQTVYLKELFESRQYQEAASPLTLALGKDIGGYPTMAELDRMPHMLIAGTTGSGKSMCINAMLFSLLYKATPEEVRLIMIDPKMLELSTYDNIPHLLAPVVTNMREAANAFRWCIQEMERRYQLMAALGVRNIVGYNQKAKQAIEAGKPLEDPLFVSESILEGEEKPTLGTLPYIVIVVDELADLMMTTGKKVEELITRIAQKARAVGIHMILATQRPSVDVITGLIKANIPARVSFQVSSKIDSRTILDQPGAEQLLGYGDMLYLPPGTAHPIRVHGGFVSDQEVHRLVDYLRKQAKPDYHEEILQEEASGEAAGEGESSEADPLYDQAVYLVTESRRASISYVQRRFKIGYNRSARLLEEMERQGVVSAMGGNGQREVLAPPPPPKS